MHYARFPRWVIAALAVMPYQFCATAVHAGIDVVLTSGAASPDGNGTLSLLYAPSLNDAGQLALVADLTGTSGGTTDNQALYRYDPVGLALIARKGQSINGKTVSLLLPASIDSGGVVAGQLALAPNPATFATVFGSGGGISKLVEPGSASPSGNNSLFSVTTYSVNDAGQASFSALYTGANLESGIYTRATNGVLTTRVIRNTPAPRGGTIKGFSNRLTMNEFGQVANILKIDDVAFDSLARIDGTTVHELARAGDLAVDGVNTLGAFTSFDNATITPIPMINDAGQIAVTAKYGAANRLGAFRMDDMGIRLIAPNNLTGSGGSVAEMNVVGIDDAGRIALWTEFSGGSDPGSGVYLADAAGQTVVALEDAATPTPGKFFRSFFSSGAALNDAGQLVFLAELSNTANGAAAGRGLYYYDSQTGLQEIVRTGDAVGGSTITNLSFSGTLNAAFIQSPDRSLSGLNNVGQVAFAFTLANGQDKIGLWTSGLDGDFNHDGTVDAADYTVWRDGLGGAYAQEDYNLWKANFGLNANEGSGANGSSSSATVPEPTSLLLFALGLSMLLVGSPGPDWFRV
ncbi:MAG: choice-of-anchor tandem repeat NxxGxxAF-containing protein [Pirellulales bacterium]